MLRAHALTSSGKQRFPPHANRRALAGQ